MMGDAGFCEHAQTRFFVDDAVLFAKMQPMRLRWGKLRGDFDRRRWLAYLAITLGFTVLGPFGTYEDLNIFTRLVYWSLVNAAVAAFMTITGDTLFGDDVWIEMARPAKAAFAAAVGAVPGSAIVWLLEHYIRGHSMNPAYLWLCVTSVGLMMMVFRFQLWRPPAKPYAPFLKRLPPDIGTDLICLSMADHYVEVRTRKGSTMLLMRFADALTELATYPGRRVHRSHWVADRYAVQLQRDGARNHLILHDGSKLPVSRAYLADVRRVIDANEERRLEEAGAN